jgi:hypothetical protein
MANHVVYHTINIAEHYRHGILNTRQGSDRTVATAMVNLATATASDHGTVAALTNTIDSLSEQMATLDVFVKAKDSDIK